MNPITAADQVDFKPGAAAITELKTGASGQPKYQPLGSTPTSEAIAQADMALSARTLTGKTIVVLITDGEPNCMWDQEKTVATITSWRTDHAIDTYVVGLPGTSGTNATVVLNALADAGGTTQYISPADPSALSSELTRVLNDALPSSHGSCP